MQGRQHDRGSKQDVQRSREENHREIISVLARASKDPRFPFRILVVSRPEPAIIDVFQASPGLSLRLFLDDKYSPHSDIRLFLVAKFAAIRRKYKLPGNWAAREVVDLLVDRASGQFVYAATVIRFVENLSRPPQEQLERVVEWKRPGNLGSSPFASLDALYAGILEMGPDPILAAKWLVCFNIPWTVTLRPSHGFAVSATGFYKKSVLESSAGELLYLLGGLSSLVRLDIDEGAGEFEVSFYHKSLLDFLGNASRSGRLHCSETDANRLIQDSHYQTLKSEFHRANSEIVYTLTLQIDRGCRGSRELPSDQMSFDEQFCFFFPHWVDPSRSYDVADATWWWNHAVRYKLNQAYISKRDIVRLLFCAVDDQVSVSIQVNVHCFYAHNTFSSILPVPSIYLSLVL